MSALARKIDDLRVFSDECFTSTDLNRRSGEVLNSARNGPVTISRNNEQFALLRREQAAQLMRAIANLEAAVELINAILGLKGTKATGSDLSWIKAFTDSDLDNLTHEIFKAVDQSKATGDWELVENTIYEWRESALLMMSGSLQEAIETEADEQIIHDPRDCPQEETEAELSAAGKP